MILYLAFGAAAVMCILLFLDRIREVKTKAESSLCATVLETARLTRDYKILLMVPITMFSGLEQAFAFGDLTGLEQAFAFGDLTSVSLISRFAGAAAVRRCSQIRCS